MYYHDSRDLLARKNHDGTLAYYHPDHLGSTTLVTNNQGAIIEEVIYEPFGKVYSGSPERFAYTGQELDPGTGLQYYGARYYDPSLAQFTTPDSLLPHVYDPQQLNRYSYVRNNPYKYTDPDGHDAVYAGAEVSYSFYVFAFGGLGLVAAKDNRDFTKVGVGGYHTSGGGFGTPGFSPSFFFGKAFNVDSVSEFRGPLNTLGVSVVPGIGVSIEASWPIDDPNTLSSNVWDDDFYLTFHLSLGGEAGGYWHSSYTDTRTFWERDGYATIAPNYQSVDGSQVYIPPQVQTNTASGSSGRTQRTTYWNSRSYRTYDSYYTASEDCRCSLAA